MTRIVRPLVLAFVAVTFATPAMARLAAAAAAVLTVSQAGQSLSSRTPTLVATGTLKSYDAKTRILTLQTTSGEMTFTLEPTTPVDEAAKAITDDALTKLTGRNTRVQYSATGKLRTVRSVHVSRARKQIPAIGG